MDTMTENSSSDTFNGWTNRETWAFNLHWQNDQGLYNMVLGYAREVVEGLNVDGSTVSAQYLGESVRDFLTEDLPEVSPELWELMRSDVGSFWRVDCKEVGDTVLESLSNES